MTWTGPLTLLLVIVGSLVELDKEGVSIQIDVHNTKEPLHSHAVDLGKKTSPAKLLQHLENLEDDPPYDSNLLSGFGQQLSGYPEYDNIPLVSNTQTEELLAPLQQDDASLLQRNVSENKKGDVCSKISVNFNHTVEIKAGEYNADQMTQGVAFTNLLTNYVGMKYNSTVITKFEFSGFIQYKDDSLSKDKQLNVTSGICLATKTMEKKDNTDTPMMLATAKITDPEPLPNQLAADSMYDEALDQIEYVPRKEHKLDPSSNIYNSILNELVAELSEHEEDFDRTTNKIFMFGQVIDNSKYKDGHSRIDDVTTDSADNDIVQDDRDNAESQENHSIVEIVTNLLYDHVLESLDQWWKDECAKYLRKYIKDMKYFLQAVGSLVKYTVQQLLILGARLVSVTFEGIDQIWNGPPGCILNSIKNLTSKIGNSLVDLCDNIQYETAEVCNPRGRVRLTIRKFMHNKHYRFNYFWYCFYTILSSLDLILMLCMLKKIGNHLNRILSLIYNKLRNIFYQTEMVNTAVGTEPYDPCMIFVSVDVFKSLVENMETEMERLEGIKKLEEQMDHARSMTEWGAEKTKGLDEVLQRLSTSMNERLTENFNMLMTGVDNIAEVPAEDFET